MKSLYKLSLVLRLNSSMINVCAVGSVYRGRKSEWYKNPSVSYLNSVEFNFVKAGEGKGKVWGWIGVTYREQRYPCILTILLNGFSWFLLLIFNIFLGWVEVIYREQRYPLT